MPPTIPSAGSATSFQICDCHSSSKLFFYSLPGKGLDPLHNLSTRKNGLYHCSCAKACGGQFHGKPLSVKTGEALTRIGSWNCLWRNGSTLGIGKRFTGYQSEEVSIRPGQTLCRGGVRDLSRDGVTVKRKESRKRGKKSGPNVKNVSIGFWRLFGVEVPLESDGGKDDFSISDGVLQALAAFLKCNAAQLPPSSFSVVRKSLDARKDPRFVYTIDLDVENLLAKEAWAKYILGNLRDEPGKAEFSPLRRTPLDLVVRLQNLKTDQALRASSSSSEPGARTTVSERLELPSSSSGCLDGTTVEKGRVVVVGSGPAGLFAALSLAETGIEVVLLERGQPVEARGRDIGALMVRRLLDPNSNLCYGEGGAGTWSDGKLTTRIGKNNSSVQTVLATLVRFGAPPHILVDGKPHVGTDKLVRILQNLRSHLLALGVNIMFGTKMEDMEVHARRVTGVRVSSIKGNLSRGSEILKADAVVLAVGHSARDVYERLLHHNVLMTAKPFAVGFRVEHPQELINEMQYHRWSNEVQRGKGKLPVADYKLAADVGHTNKGDQLEPCGRGCFSFCMCPGGQVVPTSTSPSELCINGMSFSSRASRWANAALVVSVSTSDFSTLCSDNGPLAGVAFQRVIEQEAALRGGGNFVAPVQTVTDFLADRLSGDALPSSSYRLGVKAAFLHDLLPSYIIESLKESLLTFDTKLPGFIDKRGLLHGVETRTSSPLTIERSKETLESVSLSGLYPVGEGAGYAGGIVSAAVDGMLVGLALAKKLSPSNAILQELSL